MGKKMFAMYAEHGVNNTLKYLQENNAEILQVTPSYGGYGYANDEFHFSTVFCIIYKSENEINEYKPNWLKDDGLEF